MLFVNPPICLPLLAAAFWLLPGGSRRERSAGFDVQGAVLVTASMLLLVYALVRAPPVGWGTAQTIGMLAGAGVLLAAFVVNEARSSHPLVPASVLRVKGLAAADLTMLLAFAGIFAMLLFITLYLQEILRYSPFKAGAGYVPITAGFAVAGAVSSQLVSRIGTRLVIVAGALIGAAGVYLISRVPVGGSYVGDVLRTSNTRTAGQLIAAPTEVAESAEATPEPTPAQPARKESPTKSPAES